MLVRRVEPYEGDDNPKNVPMCCESGPTNLPPATP